METPWPRVKPLSETPLKVAPPGKIASPAPVTPATSSAAAGAGAGALASPSITDSTNPNRARPLGSPLIWPPPVTCGTPEVDSKLYVVLLPDTPSGEGKPLYLSPVDDRRAPG